MYFKIIFSNGYCGCDEEIYIETETLQAADEYAQDYLVNGYGWYDAVSQFLGGIDDYESEDDYWEEVEDYQANCTYDIFEITEEEYEDNI